MTDIRQEGNHVIGDMAAGDINKPIILYTPPAPTNIGELNEQYAAETAKEQTLAAYISDLNHFSTQLPYALKDLQTKLLEAKRQSELDEALYLKERVAKRILELSRSPSAQKIMCHALAKLKQCFLHKVKPLIEGGASAATVDAAIYDDVIAPVYTFLEKNPLNLHEEDLKAMIYYLTGNCHINWTKSC